MICRGITIGGYCIFLGDNLVSWSFRKQEIVARYSTEAEYKALSNIAAELLWILSLCSELVLKFTQAPTLWRDDVGATYLLLNLIGYSQDTYHQFFVQQGPTSRHFQKTTILQ